MNDIRLYLFPILIIVNLLAAILLFQIYWIFALVFLALAIYHTVDTIFLYLGYIWWPYHNWISMNVVDVEEITIESTTKGESLKAVVIRPKNCDLSKKHIGVLFHHGYTGFKEKVYRFAIPLAMNGCVIVCPDARGHGETRKFSKALKMDDFKGIMADVSSEITYLEALPEVDGNRLMMMGHSMGGIMTLSAGYKDDRLKRLVAISAPYDMLKMFKENKTMISNFIYKRVTKFLKKDPEFIESGETLDEFSKKISAKYVFEHETAIPDKERVYVVHCKQDGLVLFNEALKIKEHLDLPDENVLFMDMPKAKYVNAAHNLTGQATIIATFVVQIAKGLEL